MINHERGSLIVQEASLGMRVVNLLSELPKVEKEARRTPRKDMPDEWKKVQAAQARLPLLTQELADCRAQRAALRLTLTDMKAWG